MGQSIRGLLTASTKGLGTQPVLREELIIFSLFLKVLMLILMKKFAKFIWSFEVE